MDSIKKYTKSLQMKFLDYQREAAETITILSSELAEIICERDALLELKDAKDINDLYSNQNRVLLNTSKRTNFVCQDQSNFSSMATPRSEIYRRSIVFGFRSPSLTEKKSPESAPRSKLVNYS